MITEMGVRVGQLYRKSTTKTTGGRIINMLDEANGGYIVRSGVVVNPERWKELQRIEEDKKKASQAIHHQKAAPPQQEAERTIVPSKVENLEKRVNEMDGKLDAILKALSSKENK